MKVISKLLILLTFCIASCSKEKTVTNDSSIRYKYYNLEKAGWRSKEHLQEVDDINYTATEVPLAYYILKDVGTSNLIAADSIEKANKTERIIEFTFIQDEEQDLLKEKFTKMDYTESVKYMSFAIEKDFYIVTSKNDTIQCSGGLFERNYKVAPFHKVMLFFAGVDPDDEIQLVYRDNLFGKGTLKFKFKEKLTRILM